MAEPTRRRSDAEPEDGSGPLARFFAAVIARRRLVVAGYALLLIPAVLYATQVRQDNSVDRLIVATDPDVVATRAFEQVFGEGEFALLLAEAADPLAPAIVTRVDEIERALAGIDRVAVNSPLSIYRRAKAGFTPTPESLAAFRAFVSGTDLFRRQGLVGDRYLAIGLILDVADAPQRRAAPDWRETARSPSRSPPAPLAAAGHRRRRG